MANYPQTTTTQFTGNITLTEGGAVGIGTTSTPELLTVQGSGSAIATRVADTTLTAKMGSESSDGRLLLYSSGTTKIDLRANNVSYLNSGRVGFGTTNPEQLIHGAYLQNAILRLDSYYSGTSGRSVIQLMRSQGATIGSKSSTSDGAYLGYLEFWGVNAAGTPEWAKAASIEVEQDGGAGATYIPGRMLFRTGTSAGAIATRMVIKNDGKVGIGVTAPSETLEVDGRVRSNTGFNINGTNGWSGTFTVKVSGVDKTCTVSGGIITNVA